MHVDDLIRENPGLPEVWKNSPNSLHVVGYQTYSDLGAVSGLSVASEGFLVCFHDGPLTFDYCSPAGHVERVDGDVRVSLGSSEFGRTTDSRWIVVARPTPTSEFEDPDKTIEGLLRFVLGPRTLLLQMFRRTLSLTDRMSSTWTHSVRNPSMLGPHQLTVHSIQALDNAITKLTRSTSSHGQSYMRALRWLNEAYQDTDIWDGFVKVWIAIEMAFVGRAQAPTCLRNVIQEAYEISQNDATDLFCTGRLYGLRKRILHDGELPKFDPQLVDRLGDLFRDVLAWKLTGVCPMILLKTLRQRNTTLRAYIDNTLNDST